MRKSYLVGYYGMQNTGDDALMNVTAWGAREYLASEQIAISSASAVKLYSGETQDAVLIAQQRFPGQNRLRHYRSALDSQRVIFGGGSVLHNAHDIDMKRDMMTLSGGSGHLALGVGIGPFANTKAERSCKKLLESCQFVGVRDPRSYEMARAIAPSANVALTFDLAPQLLNVPGFEIQALERSGIAVCLCPRERLRGDKEAETERLRKLASALETIYFFTQEPIFFVDFNGHAELGDRAVHQELASMLDPNIETHFVSYDPNPFRVLQRMASFKLIMGMRLHASVFGYLAETPVISLNYHAKCEEWCEQIGMASEHSIDATHFDAPKLVNTVCMGIADEFVAPTLPVSEAVSQSIKNWSLANESEKFDRNIRCHSAV